MTARRTLWNRLAGWLAMAMVVAACADPASPGTTIASATAGGTAPASPAISSASPAAASSVRPVCSDEPTPAWFAQLEKVKDGVPDPAGRIAFGPVGLYDDVLGQILGSLYAIDPDGSDAVRILSCQVERPRFSPDGSRLAFSIVMSDATWQVATVAVDRTGLRILTATRGYAQWPDWTPDGRSIIYADSPEPCGVDPACPGVHHTIWQMDSDGSNKRQIGNPDMLDTEVRVSPDGSEIVFDRYDPATGVQAFTIRELASGDERRVTLANTGDITHPDWTPDGRSIIYNTNQDGSAGVGQQIEVVPADDPTAPPKVLYGDVDHDAFKPAYAPDGSRIVFGCGGRICLMDADGSDVVVLVDAPGVELNHPAWGRAPIPAE